MDEKNTRLDDLECKGLKIRQFVDGYCFTSDAVLLANFVRCKKNDTIVDFGCGNGVISILLSAKTPAKKIVGIELQKEVAELAKSNVLLNNLQDEIDIINTDILFTPDILGKESVEIVVCNPPYFASTSGERRETLQIALSRHESTCDLTNLLRCASEILKYGGEFYIIHKTQRMAEVIAKASEYSLTPKHLTLIYPKWSKPADTFILKCKKCSPHGLLLDKLIVYNEDGTMTCEAQKLYNKTL